MPVTRNASKELLKSLSQYKIYRDMVNNAVDPEKPTLVKSLGKNRDKLDTAFADLTFEWESYKADLDISDTEFNAVDAENKAVFLYNSSWYTDLKKGYYNLVELSDDKLVDSNVTVSREITAEEKLLEESSKEKKILQGQRQIDSLGAQITTISESISSAIEGIRKEVVSMIDGSQSEARIKSLKADLIAQDNKLDDTLNKVYYEYISLLNESEVREKEDMRKDFIQKEKANISSILLKLSRKLKDTSVDSPATVNVGDRQSTYLKKADPPKWEGDALEFADFKRKWLSQVSTAKLPPETELDRLRENIPVRAAKALFGETEMSKAWTILENLYGDKDLITNKLKKQLKSIKVKGKQDYDIIIDLVTDVKNIVLRLKAVDAEQVLHVDNEFLGAIFRVLPATCQTKWLDYDKSSFSTKWSAFMQFLETAREQALQTKVLMIGYEQSDFNGVCNKCGKSGHKGKSCTEIKINNTKVAEVRPYQDEKKKVREAVGKCPLCKGRHTYTRLKDKDEWPSDRLFKCDDFKKMSVQERAATLQRLSACPKCTAWSHVRKDCSSQAKCGMIINGVRCNGEHSSMVCGSGNAYCGAVRSRLIRGSRCNSDSSDSSSSSCSVNSIKSDTSSSGSSSSSEDFSGIPDIDAETLLLFQEVPIVGAPRLSYTCWDNGSNRCLVTHRFASACNMRKQDVVLKLDVVGQKSGVQDSCYYLFEMIRNDGTTKKVWAFGLDSIMGITDPVDLARIRNLL